MWIAINSPVMGGNSNTCIPKKRANVTTPIEPSLPSKRVKYCPSSGAD